MLAAASPTTQNSRLGIVVAKKNVRRAIDRNRIKRLTREYFRQQVSPRSSSLDFVVLARQGMGNLNNCDVRMALKSLFDSVLKKASHEKLNPASQSHVH